MGNADSKPKHSVAFRNFLKAFREKHCCISSKQVLVLASTEWAKLSPKQRLKFACMPQSVKKKPKCKPKKPACKPKKLACKAKKPACKPKKPACKPKKAACKPKKRACKIEKKKTCGKRKKCFKPGPIMSNGFLNFMRDFRKKNCGLTPCESLKKGALAWSKLEAHKKCKYRRMGCAVTTSTRRKASPLCRK